MNHVRQPAACLSPQELEQLALGTMDDSRLESVQEHLQQCEACLELVRTMTIDDPLTSAVNAIPDVRAKLDALKDPIRQLLEGLNRQETLSHRSLTTTFIAGSNSVDDSGGSLAIGTILGNYEIEARLGQGGMGVVYKARHRRMDRVVAIKVLSAKFTRDPELVSRFQREVKTIAQLNNPHVVTAYDADEIAGMHFLAMEYVDGIDLMTHVRKSGPLRIEQAVVCALQAAQGLACAHDRDIIHRDVKPANLILDQTGVVKVLDLGLARLAGPGEPLESGLTRPGTFLGTVHFMAPEQALDAQNADSRADIYSLGCTLYFLLTGRTVFQGDSDFLTLLAHREQPVPQLRNLRSDVPVGLEAIVMRMLAKSPDDRFPSMSAVIASLQLLASRETEAVSLQTGGAGVRSRGWKYVIAGAAACLLLAALILKFKTAEGTLVLNIDPADSEVQISSGDGRVELTRRGEPGTMTISVIHGKHRLKVEKAGFQVFTEEFSTNWGNQATITAKLLPLASREPDAAKAVNENTKVEKAPAPSPEADRNRRAAEWVLRVKGQLKISVSGELERDISRLIDLPSQPFVVTLVSINASLNGSDLSMLNGLQSLRSLSLELPNNDSNRDRGLQRIHGLRSLEVLHFGSLPNATEAGLGHLLTESPKLRSVALPGEMGAFGRCLQSLTTLPQLTFLDLRNCVLNDDDMARMGTLGNLTSLHVNVNNVTQQGLTPLTNLRKLKDLNLYYHLHEAIRSPFEDQTLRTLSSLEQLELLTISAKTDDVKLTDAGLERLKAMTKLRRFVVRAPLLTDAGLKSLSEVKSLQDVQLIGSPLVTDAGLKSLASLPALKRIDLFVPLVTDDGFEHLRNSSRVLSIKLAFSRITDAGLEQIASALNSPIGYLELPYADVTDAGIVHLLPLRQLKVLDLSGTRVTDGAMEQFEKMTRLTSLDLRGTAVTEPAIAKLRKSLPLCAIRWSPKSAEYSAAIQAVRLGGKVQILQLATDRIVTLNSPLLFEVGFVGYPRLYEVPGGLCVWGLDLKESSRLTDADLRELRGLTRIEHLDLSETKITDAGLAHIAGLKTLRTLELQGTQVTDLGLSHLYALSNLRTLSLKNSKATASGLATLRSALPKCMINH